MIITALHLFILKCDSKVINVDASELEEPMLLFLKGESCGIIK